MSGRDVLLLAAIAAGCFFAVRKIHRDKKRGCGCGGNCTGCTDPCEHEKDLL